MTLHLQIEAGTRPVPHDGADVDVPGLQTQVIDPLAGDVHPGFQLGPGRRRRQVQFGSHLVAAQTGPAGDLGRHDHRIAGHERAHQRGRHPDLIDGQLGVAGVLGAASQGHPSIAQVERQATVTPDARRPRLQRQRQRRPQGGGGPPVQRQARIDCPMAEVQHRLSPRWSELPPPPAAGCPGADPGN